MSPTIQEYEIIFVYLHYFTSPSDNPASWTFYNLVIILYVIYTSNLGCGAGTGIGRNRIHLGIPAPEPEPYSEYGSDSGYKEMMQKTQKKLL